jgi:hypothetical protein
VSYNLFISPDPDKCCEEISGALCKISGSGKVFIQNDLGEVKKFPISSCVRVEGKHFNPKLLPKTNEIVQMWVGLFSISALKILPRASRHFFFDGTA